MSSLRLVPVVRPLLAGSVVSAMVLSLASAAQPAMQVVRATAAGQPLLANGGFELVVEGKPAQWQAAPQGFGLAPEAGRGRSRALVCENTDPKAWQGASQTLRLNRARTAPLVVRGWSKGEGVDGSSDSDYSLYVDIICADGTPLWGQTGDFHCGTHDWEQREFIILPEKPVQTLTLHCLFRRHAGKVWFDDVSVEELEPQAGTVLYQGAAVQLSRRAAKASGKAATLATQDGLRLGLRGQSVVSLQVDGREMAAPGPAGFLARDVAANSDFHAFEAGACRALGLKLETQFEARPDHLVVGGRVTDTRGEERAITLVFALGLDAVGWQWGEDLRRARRIEGAGEFSHQVAVRCGATGTLSLYPLGAVYNDQCGLAVALDMAHPAQYRLAYHAGARQLLMAYDFGLASEGGGRGTRGPGATRRGGAAEFRFVLYRFEPRWGFRAAFQKFMAIFPDQFAVRSREQGIWMPFTDVSKVEGWQDFGFKYHEGNNNVAFDDQHGILSFRYTEPMTWWMPMGKEVGRTLAAALRVRDELASGANQQSRRLAQAAQSAGMCDEQGQPWVLFRNEPWCNGAVWSLNPNPHLPGPLNAATVHWDQTIKRRLYGEGANGQLDGEYLDSLEGYVTAELNFRREHFADSTVPLTFATDTKRPALFKGLAVFEFTKWICDDVHRLGRLTFANGVPYRFTFLCPWLDVMGTETDWLRGGQYQPASDAQMCLWRTMSGQKPYLLLMNSDYDAFAPELVEKYFERSLFYGMFPSMFSHNAADNPYWQNPKWYNRDRALFKKYQPLIKRVAEAGWQPVTHARCDEPRIFVERFGPGADGTVYLTLFNDTAKPQSGALAADIAALGFKEPPAARELIAGQRLDQSGATWPLSLKAQEVKVIELAPPRVNTPPQ
jgi:hypothetical protein